MSYDNAANAALLSRTTGLGHIVMFWGRLLAYPAPLYSLFFAQANNDDVLVGGANSLPNTLGFQAGTVARRVLSHDSDAWVFLCLVADDTVDLNYKCYWRLEGETELRSANLTYYSAGGFTEFFFMNNPPASSNLHCQATAYKEWGAYNALTVAQILAESTQNAPIVTAGLSNYLSCLAGHAVGVDQSAAGNDWTVVAPITIAAAEPEMAIPSGVQITGLIEPLNGGSFPVFEDINGLGGLRSLANAAARDAIPANFRKEGMIVTLQDTGAAWELVGGVSNDDWAAFGAGGYVPVLNGTTIANFTGQTQRFLGARSLTANGVLRFDLTGSEPLQSFVVDAYNANSNGWTLEIQDQAAVTLYTVPDAARYLRLTFQVNAAGTAVALANVQLLSP